MSRRFVGHYILLVLLLSCRSAEPVPRSLDPEESAIVAASLDFVAHNTAETRPYAVPDRTRVFPGIGSQTERAIPPQAVPSPSIWARRSELSRLFRKHGFARVSVKYPGAAGMIQVSAPDIQGDGASLIIEFKTGVECCGAEELKLQRLRSGWVVKSRKILWVE